MARFVLAALAVCVSTIALVSAGDLSTFTMEFENLFNSKDAQGLRKLFDEKTRVHLGGTNTLKGAKRVEKFYANVFKNGGTNMKLDSHDLVTVGDDHVIHGTFSADMSEAPAKGTFNFVFNKDNLIKSAFFVTDNAVVRKLFK